MDKYKFWSPSDHLAYFKSKDKPFPGKWTLIRRVAQKQNLSTQALPRLEWMIFYETAGSRNVTKTSQHFGISRKTFHKWPKRFEEKRPETLKDQSTAPRQKRTW